MRRLKVIDGSPSVPYLHFSLPHARSDLDEEEYVTTVPFKTITKQITELARHRVLLSVAPDDMKMPSQPVGPHGMSNV
jgi:hypothetical protein